MMKIKNKVVLITGASSGIGRALSLNMAKDGAIVVAVARRTELLQSLLNDIKLTSPDSSFLAGDIGRQAFAERAVRQTVARYGRIDVLINNAAMPMHKTLTAVTPSEVERVMQVNFMACVWTSLAAIPAMRQVGGGMLVNVSSFATKVVPTHETIYVASKMALNGFTRGLWNDLAGTGIHAMLVHPGPIDTEIWSKLQQAGAYSGKLYSSERTAREIQRAIARKKREVVVPRWSLSLIMGRLVNALAPGIVRASVQRMDPVHYADPE
jgi:short-subunit dehydrogenase